MTKPEQTSATIIAAHGRHYLAQAGALKLQCVTRGKKSDVAVGDIVNLALTSPNQGVIDRRNRRLGIDTGVSAGAQLAVERSGFWTRCSELVTQRISQR